MKRFNPAKYRAKIEEAQRRINLSVNFQEPDRVPVVMNFGGSFIAKLFGYNIRDYYTDIDMQIEVQLLGLEWAYEALQDDRTGYGLYLDLGPIGEGYYWDCEIVYPEDTSPWIIPKVHTPQDIENLPIPEPAEQLTVRRVYKLYEEFKAKVHKLGLDYLPVGGGLGIHPPLSCACALMMPEKVYEYMYTEPQLIHKFFSKLLYAFFKITEFNDRYHNIKDRNSIGLADDHSSFISDELYRKFVLPYNLSIYERYGKNWRYLHSDGPNDAHFDTYVNILRLNSMDIGGWSNLELAKLKLHGKTHFSGGLNCKDLYGEFDDNLKRKIEHAIAIAAAGGGFTLSIGGETYAGVNPNTLIKAVSYAKEVGKYPIS